MNLLSGLYVQLSILSSFGGPLQHAFVLPVLIEDCELPALLQHRKYANFKDHPEEAFQELLEVIRPPRSFEPELVLIPAGEFLMGSDPLVDKNAPKAASEAEQPQHHLYLPDYYMAKTPVTNAQYAAFVQATSYPSPKHWGLNPPYGKEDRPVIEVSWYDAMAYCKWMVEVTGRDYRLPSEAEWEKGARGTDGRIYPWGNEWDAQRCNTEEDGKGETTPVGALPGASPYGLLDMAGNVWEWTISLWGKDRLSPQFRYPYDPADGREDLQAGDDVFRVARGGSWCTARFDARCAYRLRGEPRVSWNASGFRVAMSPISPRQAQRTHVPYAIRLPATERPDPYAERGEKINRRSFEDDFQHGLGAWTIRNGQSPQADKDGLLLRHFGDNDLSKMVVLKGYEFVDGVIECEVDLVRGAVFNVVFRADVTGNNPKRDDEFHLARFDTREDKPPKRKTRDGILFKPKGDGWDLCETGALDHSPPGTLTMRVEVSGSQITLYQGNQLIEQISNAKQPGDGIALLAEKQDVHVRMIRVTPE